MVPVKYLQVIFGRKAGELATLLLVALLFYLFVCRGMRFFEVPSGSMEPTLLPMDRLITLDERTYGRGDVVVLRDPQDKQGYIVKRIVAVGGDTVSVSGGALHVNGKYVSEPYINDPPQYYVSPVRVPEGEVFLLGDNRNNSDDSHGSPEQGHPVESIIGRVRFIYYPYSRFGSVKRYRPLMISMIQPVGT